MNKSIKTLAFLCLFFVTKIGFSQQPTDCIDAIVVCGNSNVNLDVNGIGRQELGFGQNCSSQENNSLWLKVTLATGGTLGFTLTPNSTAITEDYDFFVFGPNVSCGNIGSSIRCSTTNPQAANQNNNLTGMNGTAKDTAEGPGEDGDSFVKWLDVLAGETYYIVIDRPIGNSPFQLEWTGTAKFSDPPKNESALTAQTIDLESCDVVSPFSDGITNFNLELNTPYIKGSQNNVFVTYHTSASDANIGANSVSSPFTNQTNPQTIYARITDNTTGCFDIADFKLVANIGPKFKVPTNLIACDNQDDGNDANGRITFDLTSKNTEILDGQNPTDLNISYYRSFTDADTKNKALPNLYYNNTPFLETVFVRIEDGLSPDCRSIASFDLIVNPLPEANNYRILQCDDEDVNIGKTLFNLNQSIENITGNTANRTINFYVDAYRTIPINNSAFYNTTNPQIIYVEVINNTTNCKSNAELTLEVSVTNANNATLETCDDDGTEDGLHLFNLNEADAMILNGIPATGLTISYYDTYENALLENKSLPINYTNNEPDTQTIYARVENNNNCYGISTVLLTMHKLPTLEANETTFYCLNKTPESMPINAGIGFEDPNNFSYVWNTGETTSEIAINTPATYTVTVTNTNNCSKVRTITVQPSNIATIERIDIKDASQNNTISVIVSGDGTYEYALFNETTNLLSPYQTTTTFENVKPGFYTVYVKDLKNNCGVVAAKVSVIGFPKILTPNGDGFNDTWQVYGVSSMFQPNTKIQIFNRFGKLITEINPLGNGWDGLFNGNKLPTDDYWFTVTLQDGRIFKSHFSLKR